VAQHAAVPGGIASIRTGEWAQSKGNPKGRDTQGPYTAACTHCARMRCTPKETTMAFDGSAIRALLDDAVAKGTVHGIAALVVDRDAALFQHTSGEAHERTLYRNASMTKAVATTGALQLVEQGRLDLDATVASILPEFGQLQLLEGFDGDTPRLRPPGWATSSAATSCTATWH
jgi:CubicO group peptidase (beta-lactamase class C family)